MLAGWVMVKFQYPFSLFCHTDSYESHALAYTRQVQYVAVCCYERNLMEGAETLYGCRTVFTVSQQVRNGDCSELRSSLSVRSSRSTLLLLPWRKS